MIGSGLTTVFVAQVGDALAATCVLAVVPSLTRRARPFGVIENVVIDPGHRQRGLGRAVLEAALRTAWDADCHKVMLATGSRKPETLSFYAGAGSKRGGKTYFEARRP
jgi:GNAT superfamily N-acetyltransferase